MSVQENILEVSRVTNRFGEQLVHDDISFDIQRGEILALIGGSGSGKSVMLKTMTGLHIPQAGMVKINGKPLPKIPAKKRAGLFGVLFQQGALFSSLTVSENIMFALTEHSKLRLEEREKLAAFKLDLVGLAAEVGNKYPSELSGGMIKRASLARALALDPAILFLDEPTAGLDPVAATAFDEMIAMLNHTLGVTIVMITHDLDTLFSVCHRAAVLVDKKVIVEPLESLLDSDHPWIHEYLHGPRAYGAMVAAEKAAHHE